MSSPVGAGQTVSAPSPSSAPADETLSRILKEPGRADPRKFSNKTELVGKVVGQPDGDGASLQLADGSKAVVRLAYIDTPETAKPGQNKPGQPYGEAASAYLHELMKGKEIRAKIVEPATKKNYWRPVVELYAGDMNINEAMLESGYAWPQKRALAENYAIAASRGINKRRAFSSDQESPGKFRSLFRDMEDEIR